MARISNEFIEELRRTNISDLLSAEGIHVHGNKHKPVISCIAPDHEDKNPSMSLNLDTNQFNCFSCGCSGTGVIDMYAHMHGKDTRNDFVDIIKEVSQTLGKTVEYIKSSDPKSAERKEVYHALAEVVKESLKAPYFDDDREAFSAELARRGTTREESKIARIGLLPKNFANSPTAKKYEDALLKAGVLGKSEETGKIYSQFAGRLTLPITNRNGLIVGLAGRKIKESDWGAKYVNTKETVNFKKKETLYGLHSALEDKTGLVDNIDVVEGYFDVITAQAAGQKQTVATMGTALTNDHMRELARNTKAVTFIFDPDEAGIKAANKAMLAALPYLEKLEMRFVAMPEIDGEKLDPDTFIKKYGVNEYLTIKDDATSIIDKASDYIVGEDTSSLQVALSSGMLDRGREVYTQLRSGLARELISAAVAKSASRSFGLEVNPEQLGMTINEDEEIKELRDEVQELKRELSAPKADPGKVDQLEAEIAELKKSLKVSNAQTQYYMSKGSANTKPEKEAPKPPKKEADNNSYKAMKEGGGASQRTPQYTNNEDTGSSTPKDSKKPKRSVPFKLGMFNINEPEKGAWVATGNGYVGKVMTASSVGFTLKTNDNDISLQRGKDRYITLNVEGKMKSKFDGEFHKVGDTIIKIGGKWTGGMPSEYVNSALDAKQQFSVASNNGMDRHILMGMLNMQESINGNEEQKSMIHTLSDDQIKRALGLEDFIEKPEVDCMPAGVIVDKMPKKNDYIITDKTKGRIHQVKDVEPGSNQIRARDTVEQSEEVFDREEVLVLNPIVSVLSNRDSDIANQGQPIFKFAQDLPWVGEVPEDWQEEAFNSKKPHASQEYDASPTP